MLARLSVAMFGAVLLAVPPGCTAVTDFINPELLTSLTGGQIVNSLPDEAPGLLVSVENRTSRWAELTVSYRMADGGVETYTTSLNPGNKSGQMLVCPVEEITLGSVSDLDATGAVVALMQDTSDLEVDETTGRFIGLPLIEVEPFGVLLREGVNYDCGDSVLFVVRSSAQAPSGYETIAFFRRSGAQAAPTP